MDHTSTQVSQVILPYRLKGLNLTLDVVKPGDHKDVSIFMAKIFSQEEPQAMACGALQEDFQVIAMDELKESMEPSLSIVTKNESSEIVSASVVDHFHFDENYFDPNTSPYPQKYGAFLAIAAQMKDFVKKYYNENGLKGKVAYISFVSTEPGFRGKNISLFEFNAFAQVAIANGFTQCFAECTNIFSRNAALKSEMKAIHTIAYDTYTYRGEKPFQHINKLVTDNVNAKFGFAKYSDVAKESTLVYAPMDIILKSTNASISKLLFN